MVHLNYVMRGYVFNEAKQQLEEFVAKKIKFDFETSSVIYECEGRTIDSVNSKVYADISEFESGKRNESKWHSMHPSRACGGVYGVYATSAWIIDNGKPKEINLLGDNLLVLDAETHSWEKDYLYGNCYDSEQGAIDMNEFVVVDINGNKSIHKGFGRRIQLTEEQLKIKQELMDVLQKAKENDMRFFLNEDYRLCIVNEKELNSGDYVYYHGDCEGHREITKYVHKTDMDINCFGDDGLFAYFNED